MVASCQPDQKANEPCYSVEAVKLDDNGTRLCHTSERASETQSFCGTDFTKLVCLRGPDESCRSAEALKNWTWQDAVGGVLTSRVYTVRGKDRGRQVWRLVLLSSKSEEYKEQFLRKLKSGTNVANWGYVIESGWGEDPPQSIMDKVGSWMGV